MADELASVTLANLTAILAAIGGLGTAAAGLVDATKAFGGGLSNPGFGFVQAAVTPLLVEAGQPGEATAFGKKEILETLRANWLNGVAKADQKAAAKSLVRLGLTPESAPQLAQAVGVDAARLRAAAQSARQGQPLTPQDLDVLGTFDVVVSAILDRGYERGDQYYRNWAKVASAGIAIVLAVFGGYAHHPVDYWGTSRMLLAALIGAVSTPLAPVVKDLTTSLNAAVKAVASVKR